MNKDEFIENIENLIITDGSKNRLDESAFKKKIIELWNAISNMEGSVIPYARISQIIFTLEDDVADVILRMEDVVNQIRQKSEVDDKLLENYGIDKVIQNLNLANTQKSFLYRSQQNDITDIRETYEIKMSSLEEKAEQITEDIEQKIEEVKKSSDKLSNELDSAVDNRMNSIYSGFVSVLGIFVSISFTLFGAATLIKNIFDISTSQGFDTSHKVLGANIILAGFTTILVYLLIVGLMQSISSVTKLDYDFSLRRIFVILFVSSGIIIIGFIYKNPDISQFKHPIIYIVLFSFYILLGIICYRYGEFIKLKLLRINYKFKIRAVESPNRQDDVLQYTNFDIYIRNVSLRAIFVEKILIGDKKNPTKKIIDNSRTIRAKEVAHFFANQISISEIGKGERWYQKLIKRKVYIYIYTPNRVVKHKVIVERK